jgi:imidazolonepropionase
MTDLLLTGIGRLVTNAGPPVLGAAVAVDSGRISYVGPETDAPAQGTGGRIDCEGRAVIPGFVDAHTHLVFAGERSAEFVGRLAGTPYTGGGILSTVAATRTASEDDLFRETAARARRMIAAGTTTLEVKTGYGLDLTTEQKLLRVARRLGEELPLTVKSTFLGAHTVPREFQSDRDGYVDLLVDEMLPVLAPDADFCDVFVEQGAFTVDEGRRILEAASVLGLSARVHAEQLSHSGGALLAAELGAMSADHLDWATVDDADALAAAGVSAVLTPGASYSLQHPQAPGPMLIQRGVNVALATDCNPGTSYLESMGLVISLACVQMGLTVEQAVFAATRGGAIALGVDDHGLVKEGAAADLVVLDAPSESHFAYRPATNLAWKTIRGGSFQPHLSSKEQASA